MPKKKKLLGLSDEPLPVGMLGIVVRGWKYLSESEKLLISYKVVFAVDRAGRYWRSVEDDRAGPLIIGK